MTEYFAMGGYAAFIWPSYGVAIVLLIVLFLLSARRLNAAENALNDESSDTDTPGGDA